MEWNVQCPFLKLNRISTKNVEIIFDITRYGVNSLESTGFIAFILNFHFPLSDNPLNPCQNGIQIDDFW